MPLPLTISTFQGHVTSSMTSSFDPPYRPFPIIEYLVPSLYLKPFSRYLHLNKTRSQLCMQIVIAHVWCHVIGTLCAKSNPIFWFPAPHCLFTMILFFWGGRVPKKIYRCLLMMQKTVVNHLVNGCTVLLYIENSKNDKLKVILLCSTLTFSQTATSNITFSLSFLLFSMRNNTVEPLTRW